jgi:hypothetical protein
MPAIESRSTPSIVSISFMDGSFWNNAICGPFAGLAVDEN